MKRFKFVFELGSVNGLQMLALVEKLLKQTFLSPVFFLHGIKVSTKALEKKIAEKKSWPSGVSSCGLELKFGLLPALGYAFLVIEELESKNNKLEDEIEVILGLDGFVQAWVADVEYDFWQNATDPLEYECAGRSFSSLPMKSNGLPAPLDRLEIDTSQNPGRNVNKEGYIEAIGSTMWLGNLFWERVGLEFFSRVFLLENAGTKVHKCNGVLKIVAADKAFSDDSTREQQSVLRQILYGLS